MTGRVLVLVGAVAATAAFAAALVPRGGRSVRLGRALLGVAAAALALALVSLGVALVSGDYSLVYVADHTRRGASAWYRLAGLWGGMEGSLLLWTTLLGGFAVLGARAGSDRGERPEAPADRARDPRRGRRERATLAVLAGSVAAFALAILTTADPFRTLQIPATDGGGLVPILEHPAMLVHPPLLYAGLVSTVVTFAATVGALTTRTLDSSWRRWVRRWQLVSWVLLALGMVTGANWAYVELGWGGYWAWDPIENTALLPWLAATAALHQLLVPADRRPTAPGAGLAALVLLGWVLAVLGTVVTRSGAAVSVHAFGESDAVALVLTTIWVATVLVAGIALVLGRAPNRGTEIATGALVGSRGAWWRSDADRSTLLRFQTVLVLAAIALITAGTVTPVVRSQLGGAAGATTGDFFAAWTAPLAWVALAAMVVAPALAPSGRVNRAELGRIVAVPALVGLAVAALAALVGWTSPRTLVTAGLAGAAGASAIALLARRPPASGGGRRTRATVGAHVAHLGFAVLLLGLGGATAGSDRAIAMATGETTELGGVTVRNDGVRTDPGVDGNPRVIARFVVDRGGRQQVLEPEIVGYPAMGVRLAESALWSDPTGDVQLAMRTADDDGRVLLDIHVRPLTPLVWWGALLLAAGGIVAGTVRRHVPAAFDGVSGTASDDGQPGSGDPASPDGSGAGPDPAPRRLRSSRRPTVSGGAD